MAAIAQAGYTVEAVADSLSALYQLSRPDATLPMLILLSDRLTPVSSLEFCRILRRLAPELAIPVVLYSDVGHLDAKQRQQALEAGATHYLHAGEFTIERLTAILRAPVSTDKAKATPKSGGPFWRSAFSTLTDTLG